MIGASHAEVSLSTLFAAAAILEGELFVNGAPHNTFVLGAIELAECERSFIGGDDLKSGQTKLKSVLAEFLVNAGIKPLSIASYNHLGNNDGHNLSAEPQFKSKEISKSSVVDDMVESNRLLFKAGDVNAKDKATNKDQSMTIASSSGLSDKDIERMVSEAEQYAETDKERKALIEEANKADSVCADTEKGMSLPYRRSRRTLISPAQR